MPSRLKPLNFLLSMSVASSLWKSVRKQCSSKIELSISTEIRLTRLFVHQSVGPHTKIASFCPQAFFSPRDPSPSSYLFERHFICSGSLVIFHLFTAHMIPVFIYPALLNHFTLLAPFPSPPSSSTQAGDFLCFLSCPDLPFAFLPSLLFPPFPVISPVTSLLFSSALHCFYVSLPMFSPDPPLSIVPRAMLVQRHRRAWSLAHTHASCGTSVHAHTPMCHREQEKGRSCSVCWGEHIAWGFGSGEWKLSPVRYWVCIYGL